ncbi:hypothetical protein scyTo_0012703 [Scyliorhinus torazame]|uniref:Bicarbonate transporter-like transmembrane domain-containing protein n=1 Tax=Scyliorhinus torazame TaxID=75743 RepID=A0A401NH88_SCYTO|nr:hypothetical protein [Scyliorhinus torazame]
MDKSAPLDYNATADFTNDVSVNPLQEQLNNKFKKQIPEGAEATNVLVGEVDFLDKPFVAFVRLKEATILGALTEIPLPTRFLFILLGPKAKAMAYHQIGRAVATLLTDEARQESIIKLNLLLFHIVAFKAKLREDLLAGIDEFLDEVTVLPPGKWDPTLRIAPPKILPSLHKRLFGGLINDIKRKAPWFASDFYDALNLQCLSAVLFIYLASVTNAITFGGILGDATDNMQVRKLISDFSIILSILIFCGVDVLVGVDTPKLIVPSELKKGAGFHLDLFWIAILMILTSFMGLPWYVSATVISLAHIDSLKMETAKSAPGVEPTFMGVSGSWSCFWISPAAAVAASGDTAKFMDRLKLLFTPAKHQPDLIYLRHVPLRRIHLFTLLQVLCLVLLWVLKSTAAAIIFPVMLLALVGVRKAMECIFSRHDLSWLDDAMPEKENKVLEEKTDKSISSNKSEDSEYLYLQKGPDINISVN